MLLSEIRKARRTQPAGRGCQVKGCQEWEPQTGTVRMSWKDNKKSLVGCSLGGAQRHR